MGKAAAVQASPLAAEQRGAPECFGSRALPRLRWFGCLNRLVHRRYSPPLGGMISQMLSRGWPWDLGD